MNRGSSEALLELECHWTTGESFLERYVPSAEGGPGRFVFHGRPGWRPPPGVRRGRVLGLRLWFDQLEVPLRVHARVLEVIDEKDAGSLRLEFLEEERDREVLVVACAHGENVPFFRRRHERVRCDLPVRIRDPSGDTERGRVAVVSERGAHLVIDTLHRPGTLLDLAIRFPHRWRRVRLRAEVRSVIEGGPQRGVGVEFHLDDRKHRLHIAEGVALVRARRLVDRTDAAS